MVPRVYVDGGQSSFYKSVGNNRLHFQKTVSLISDLVKEHEFDGIVWDTPFNYFEQKRRPVNFLIVDLIHVYSTIV